MIDAITATRRGFAQMLAALPFAPARINNNMASQINLPRYGNIFINCDTFADLRAISSTVIATGYSAIVAGGNIPADGLGGLLVWNSTSTAADNGQTVIAPADGSTGRWLKIATGITGPVGPVGPQGGAGPVGPLGGNVMSVGLFTNASALSIPIGADLVRTSGYTTTGVGPADYVCDALATPALLAQFPNCVFQSANGRIFRLSGSVLYTIQTGAVGVAGTNDQPAIQQALGYANAVGIRTVECSHTAYELWCPLRGSNLSGYDPSGIPMVISQNLWFKGLAGGTSFSLKNSLGGPKTTITQQGSNLSYDSGQNYAWQGGGIYVKPAGAQMEWVTLTDLHIDGGVPYICANYEGPTTAERSMLNLTDKGFRIQDTTVQTVTIKDCSLRNFGGEIYYIGGAGVTYQDIQDTTFEGSPQCAMNPGSPAAFYFRNVKAGKSYQNEMLGGSGGAMLGCKFYDLYSMFLSGGPDGSFLYNYSYPVRRTDIAPPYIDLTGTRFERIATASLTSYCIGSIVAVDTPISLSDTGKLTDVNLRIDAFCDLGTNYEAFSISGPANTTTAVAGAPSNVYEESPRNIRVEVVCHRTGLAMANNRGFKNIMRLYSGLLDQSCQFILDGESYQYFDQLGAAASGFAFPRIDIKDTARALSYDYGCSVPIYPSADFTLNLIPGPNTIDLQAGGTFTLTATATYPLATGQRVKIINNSPAGRSVHIPASAGAGIALSGDRILSGQGSFLELEQQASGQLIERGFSSQAAPTTTTTSSGSSSGSTGTQ